MWNRRILWYTVILEIHFYGQSKGGQIYTKHCVHKGIWGRGSRKCSLAVQEHKEQQGYATRARHLSREDALYCWSMKVERSGADRCDVWRLQGTTKTLCF